MGKSEKTGFKGLVTVMFSVNVPLKDKAIQRKLSIKSHICVGSSVTQIILITRYLWFLLSTWSPLFKFEIKTEFI